MLKARSANQSSISAGSRLSIMADVGTLQPASRIARLVSPDPLLHREDRTVMQHLVLRPMAQELSSAAEITMLGGTAARASGNCEPLRPRHDPWSGPSAGDSATAQPQSRRPRSTVEPGMERNCPILRPRCWTRRSPRQRESAGSGPRNRLEAILDRASS
jgi:hypothetical protein